MSNLPNRKYSTENEMILDLMPAILGSLVPRKIRCFAEVPRYSGNDHTDIMLIDDVKKAVFAIEFKLNGPKSLNQQVEYNWRRFACIGIINAVPKDKEKHYWLYPYTGDDSQLERICSKLRNLSWCSINESDIAGIYYWGYLKEQSCFDAGHSHCKRISLFQLYRKAVINIQEFYNWKLDFYLVYKALGYYAVSTAKMHYNAAISECSTKPSTV